MRALIMKVGTGPSSYYYVRESRLIVGTELSVGQQIRFREQNHGAKWERGIVREISGDVPIVERW